MLIVGSFTGNILWIDAYVQVLFRYGLVGVYGDRIFYIPFL